MALLVGVGTHADLYDLTFVHAELIDRVIDSLLDEYIDTIIIVFSVSKFTNVHTRTTADVFAVIKMDDVVVGVGARRFDIFCHKWI